MVLRGCELINEQLDGRHRIFGLWRAIRGADVIGNDFKRDICDCSIQYHSESKFRAPNSGILFCKEPANSALFSISDIP